MQLELPLFEGLNYYNNQMRINKMAEQEKDNTLTVVIAVTVVAIVGVLMLKKDEVKHLQMSASTTPQAEAALTPSADGITARGSSPRSPVYSSGRWPILITPLAELNPR
jgi:hypothetical protein